MKDTTEEIVYEMICKSGCSTAVDIGKALKLENRTVSRAINSLEKTGLVRIENPAGKVYPVRFRELLPV